MASAPALSVEALCGIESAQRFFADMFAGADPRRETLFVAHLDCNATCIHLSRFEGGAGAVPLPVRTIIGDAARLGSAALVLAHNHPSGDSTPSEDDRRATRRLAIASDAIDTRLVDHLVFAAGGDCRSFRALGLL